MCILVCVNNLSAPLFFIAFFYCIDQYICREITVTYFEVSQIFTSFYDGYDFILTYATITPQMERCEFFAIFTLTVVEPTRVVQGTFPKETNRALEYVDGPGNLDEFNDDDDTIKVKTCSWFF